MAYTTHTLYLLHWVLRGIKGTCTTIANVSTCTCVSVYACISVCMCVCVCVCVCVRRAAQLQVWTSTYGLHTHSCMPCRPLTLVPSVVASESAFTLWCSVSKTVLCDMLKSFNFEHSQWSVSMVIWNMRKMSEIVQSYYSMSTWFVLIIQRRSWWGSVHSYPARMRKGVK